MLQFGHWSILLWVSIVFFFILCVFFFYFFLFSWVKNCCMCVTFLSSFLLSLYPVILLLALCKIGLIACFSGEIFFAKHLVYSQILAQTNFMSFLSQRNTAKTAPNIHSIWDLCSVFQKYEQTLLEEKSRRRWRQGEKIRNANFFFFFYNQSLLPHNK